jgi:hypothetical protein
MTNPDAIRLYGNRPNVNESETMLGGTAPGERQLRDPPVPCQERRPLI